jgi:hypothetical protein
VASDQNFTDLGSTEHSVENHEMRNREKRFFHKHLVMTIVLLGKELVQKSSVSELQRSQNEVSRHSAQDCRNDKTRFKGNVNKVHPTMQINWSMIGRLLFSLTVNSSITNLLAKQTHDCKSVCVSVARTIVSLLPKEMRSGTAVGVCIKENETDCVWLVVLYEKSMKL